MWLQDRNKENIALLLFLYEHIWVNVNFTLISIIIIKNQIGTRIYRCILGMKTCEIHVWKYNDFNIVILAWTDISAIFSCHIAVLQINWTWYIS